MGYSKISIYQYRNLMDQKVSLDAPRIFLVGENGQGKSNFLEAIYLLSYGASFRTKRDAETIRHGREEMSLHGNFLREEEEGVPGQISLSIVGKEKSISLNGKKLSDRKDLIRTMPAIVFTHEDISMVSGPPEERRRFFNQTMSLFEPLFIDRLRSYRKILKMRNNTLKNGSMRAEIMDAYDLQLAEAGMELQKRRKEVSEEFSRLFSSIFAEVSGLEDPLTVEYRPSWGNCESADEAVGILTEKRERDFELGSTTAGPHRDRFLFRYRGGDFTKIASTGQLRLISLLLRVGQCRYFTEKTGRRPILLLDDVLLELDGKRRERFLAHLPAYEQAFFTFLPDEQYTGLAEGETHIYTVEDGWIQTP